MSNNLKTIVSNLFKSQAAYSSALDALRSDGDVKKAARKGREHVYALLLPHVAAYSGCALTAKARARGVGDQTLDKADENFETARNRMTYVVKCVFAGASAKDAAPAKKTKVSRDCMQAVERLLNKYDRKMVLEAIKRFQ